MLAESSSTTTTSGRSVRCRCTVQPYSMTSTRADERRAKPGQQHLPPAAGRRALVPIDEQHNRNRRQQYQHKEPGGIAQVDWIDVSNPLGRPIDPRRSARPPICRQRAFIRAPAELPGQARLDDQQSQHRHSSQRKYEPVSLAASADWFVSRGRLFAAKLAGKRFRVEACQIALAWIDIHGKSLHVGADACFVHAADGRGTE